MTHTKRDAEILVFFLKKMSFEDVKLLNSFSKGVETSEHDIDILFPYKKRFNTIDFANWMKELLDAQSFEKTDMGSWYFHNTFFGNVDMFCNTEIFDY